MLSYFRSAIAIGRIRSQIEEMARHIKKLKRSIRGVDRFR